MAQLMLIVLTNSPLMLIGIDASRYRHAAPTGVEIYSDEIIDGILEIFGKQKKHQIRLYTPKKIPKISKNLQHHPGGAMGAPRLWTQRHLTKEMKQSPPDVLFIPSHVLPRKHPQKSVITIHDVAFREFPSAYSFFQYSYLNWSSKFAVKHAWKIIVPSQATAQDLKQIYDCDPEKIVVIPHGFRSKKFKMAPSNQAKILKRFHLHSDDPYIFFVGRLETKKNLSRLIQAFGQFRKTHPEWQLVLGGGRGVGFRAILKALQKEDLLHHVLMPGYLTEEEKHVLLSHANIFAFPSLSEGFGFPILEAASYNIPLLASQIPALLEFKDLVDIFVDPHNVRSIANGLNTLADPKTSVSQKSVTHYSWEHAAREVWKLLTQA